MHRMGVYSEFVKTYVKQMYDIHARLPVAKVNCLPITSMSLMSKSKKEENYEYIVYQCILYSFQFFVTIF